MKMRATCQNLYVFILVFVLFTNCSTEQNEPASDLVTIDESERFSTAVAKLKAPELVNEAVCETPRLFELRDPEDLTTSWGTVTIYNDGEKLYIQYNIVDGWSINALWVYIGNNWPYTEDPGDDWHKYPGIEKVSPRGEDGALLNLYTLEYDIEDWKDDGCFVIALKVRLWEDGANPRDANQQIPRVYINYGDHLDYVWNDPYCLCEGPGTGTPGYWKNHANAWPVESIIIGGVKYTVYQAIAIMKRKGVQGDKTYNMFEQLVAAKLNVAIGNASGCIEDTIIDADNWMSKDYGLSFEDDKVVSGDSQAWKKGEPLHSKLDDYNNGRLCAEHRD